MASNTNEIERPRGLELHRELGMDPETGFVEVCLRYGDVSRSIRCEELEMDDASLLDSFARNALLDTPEGPAYISSSDWQHELSRTSSLDRPAH